VTTLIDLISDVKKRQGVLDGDMKNLKQDIQSELNASKSSLKTFENSMVTLEKSVLNAAENKWTEMKNPLVTKVSSLNLDNVTQEIKDISHSMKSVESRIENLVQEKVVGIDKAVNEKLSFLNSGTFADVVSKDLTDKFTKVDKNVRKKEKC